MAHKAKLDDGTLVEIPTPRLSFTQVDMYLRCPRQYELRYVYGIKEPPGIAMTEGSAGHDALEHNNLHKMKSGADLPKAEVVEAFNDALSTRIKSDHDDVDQDDVEDIRERAVKYLGEYVELHAPGIIPESAEEKLEFDVAGVPFIAYTDLVTKGDPRVYDYKVTGSRSQKFQRGYMDEGLQLTLYSMAKDMQNVGVIGLIKDKPPKTGPNAGKHVRVLKAARTEAHHRQASAIVRSVVKGISMGSFPQCPPDTWVCTNRFCGYYKCWERKFKKRERKPRGRVVIPKPEPKEAPPPRRVLK